VAVQKVKSATFNYHQIAFFDFMAPLCEALVWVDGLRHVPPRIDHEMTEKGSPE
jgi:hypothetical protein